MTKCESILVDLLKTGKLRTARELLQAYRKTTGDLSHSCPRMALLGLIEDGKVKWGDGGEVALQISEKRTF